MKDKEALQNRLKADIDQYESMIEDELVRKKELLKKVAIVGGIITAGYVLTSVLTKDDDEQKVVKKSDSSFVKLLLGVATPIAMNFLKEQLANRS